MREKVGPYSKSKHTADEKPCSGGDPEGLGRCTECGSVYPVQQAGNDRVRPIGTHGACRCGNTEFTPVN